MDDGSAAVRLRAYQALRKLGIKPSPASVRQALSDDAQDVRTAALQLLAAQGEATAQEGLHQRFGTKFTELRAEIVSQLGRLDLKRWNAVVTSALQDREERVRLAAARTLARSRDRELAPALRKAERDESWAVRVVVTDALLRLGEKADTTFYRKALQDPNWLARQTAAEVLAERRGKRALPEIRSLLNDRDSYVRRTALVLVAKLSGPESAPVLRQALADTDPWVRDTAAALILQRIP